jgi:T5orf172 domain
MKTFKDNRGFVYVMHDEHTQLCKIGCTRDPWRRTDEVSAGSVWGVSLLRVFTVADMYKAERLLHYEFRADRVHGEWFDLSDDLIFALCSRFCI